MELFIIDIKGKKHNTWQGSIKGERGENTQFHSTLDMLKAIDHALENGSFLQKSPE